MIAAICFRCRRRRICSISSVMTEARRPRPTGGSMPVHIDKALDINEAMVEGVDFRHEERQRTQVWLFGGEELPRAGVQMPFQCRVHLVAEGPRLAIEIGKVGKGAPGEEIVLDEMKGALNPRRAIRIPFFMGAEDEAEALGKRRH